MRILLTGFGPFPGISDNPIQRLAEYFAARPAAGCTIVSRVLPVSFAHVSLELPRLLAEEAPDAFVLLGVASREHRTLRVETLACNACRGTTPDVDGCPPPNGPIAPVDRPTFPTTAPVERILDALRAAGLPVRLSEDAGRYVCNYAYFTALHALEQSGRLIPCVFLHVPEANRFFPLDRQAVAVETVLTAIASSARPADSEP